MRKFLIQVSFFSLLLSGSFVWICSNADGFTDAFYIRFTSPKQNNLILGTSRAAQGLQPSVFKTILNKNIYNYSFTIMHSPFGPTYLKSIQRKIKPSTKDGIFIITVDPWSLSSLSKTPNKIRTFRELNQSLANTEFVNLNPNPIYFVNNWNDNFYKIMTKKHSKMFLHDDGWLEVSIKMDSTNIERRIKNKIETYKINYLPKANYSEIRYQYLLKTIKFLSEHGKVYLVRLPIDNRMMNIDNELMPNFDIKIQKAISNSSGYLDLTERNNEFEYTDGNHLYKKSGKKVSEIVSLWIKNKVN